MRTPRSLSRISQRSSRSRLDCRSRVTTPLTRYSSWPASRSSTTRTANTGPEMIRASNDRSTGERAVPLAAPEGRRSSCCSTMESQESSTIIVGSWGIARFHASTTWSGRPVESRSGAPSWEGRTWRASSIARSVSSRRSGDRVQSTTVTPSAGPMSQGKSFASSSRPRRPETYRRLPRNDCSRASANVVSAGTRGSTDDEGLGGGTQEEGREFGRER